MRFAALEGAVHPIRSTAMSLNLATIAAAASAMQNHYAEQIDPIGHPLDAVAINPQPLPPREALLGSLMHNFDAVALNPQPLPPREALLGSLMHNFDAVALNPQPLPPREALSLVNRIGMMADEWCGTVPHRLPHLPPPPPSLDTASR
jgi:hypothetical protein